MVGRAVARRIWPACSQQACCSNLSSSMVVALALTALLFAPQPTLSIANDYCDSYVWDVSVSLEPFCPPCKSIYDHCRVSGCTPAPFKEGTAPATRVLIICVCM